MCDVEVFDTDTHINTKVEVQNLSQGNNIIRTLTPNILPVYLPGWLHNSTYHPKGVKIKL